MGNCRQSVKNSAGAPGLDARRAAALHSVDQKWNARWSRLSPPKSVVFSWLPLSVLKYFVFVSCARSPRNAPPLL
jgi:hypothetical protein